MIDLFDVSKGELKVRGKSGGQVDEKAIDRLLDGKIDLATALGAGAEAQKDMRRQAIALCGAGKWQACVDVVLGVTALGTVHPVDAVLLSRCYRALGDAQSAEYVEREYEALLRELQKNGAA